jgi:hypothetical protein
MSDYQIPIWRYRKVKAIPASKTGPPKKDSKERRSLEGEAKNVKDLKVEDHMEKDDLLALITFGWQIWNIPRIDAVLEDAFLKGC